MVNEPFFDLMLIRTEKNLYFLNQNHHIAFDGTCNLLLAEAILTAYRGEPLRPDTYYLYLDRLQKNRTPEYEAELDRYFHSSFEQKKYRRFPEPEMKTKLPQLERLDVMSCPFSVAELKETSKKLGGTPGVVSFAAVLLAFAKCSGEKNLISLMQYNNRDDLISDNTFGLLARSIPVAVEFAQLHTVHDLMEDLKIRITQGMAYDCMEKLIGDDTPEDTECLTFVYEGDLIGAGQLSQLGGKPVFLMPSDDASRDFAVLFAENGNDLISSAAFRRNYYAKDKVQEFQNIYLSVLCELVTNKNAGSIPLRHFLQDTSREE